MGNVLTETTPQTASSLWRRLIWLVLFSLLLLSIAFVAIPVFLIQPFRPQTERALEISYLLRRWSPLVTAIMLAAAFALVLWQWRHARRWWRKALLVIVLLLLIVPAWFARQNHFEWMFNPLQNSAYVKTADAGFVAHAVRPGVTCSSAMARWIALESADAAYFDTAATHDVQVAAQRR